MNRSRRPCLTMVLAAIVTMILFGCLCGLTLRVIFRPPFLMWQHGAEFVEPVTAYMNEQFPHRAGKRTVRIIWVKEYTDICSVVLADVGGGPDDDAIEYWVLLYRDSVEHGPWQALWAETQGGLAPVLALGAVCGEEPGFLDLPDWDVLRQATLVVP